MTGRISEAIQQDHNEIEACFEKIVHSSSRDEQTRFQTLFTWELARHLVGEEIVVFPALEKHLPDGRSMADTNRKHHHHIKEQLKQFQSMSASNVDFLRTLDSLMTTTLLPHMREEEANDLSKLEDVLSHHDSLKLAKAFSRTKIFAPSRSHPHVPDKPPFETVVGLLAAPIDQLADLFRKWPHEGQPG
ncbi:hypothetical protein ASPZODRAFT_76588 [Penicilliopsis zonata CBS 506.65]|uniref:Hemerythrin-like domain-containing protein n=1 Tax=Penicilliopsis zonata CBS 506.65 TaxID=1073090 RepID=A0A1L9S638_9EURO|nr:hypothetical protein ASPZODRAFT_76588 [Penicilliopsis zonata CBS 506.65]OJJ42600.1 hypothetical protein ASPZODRAFT_76588 [Penicilliopsis zonata CBS 506.65]